MAMSKFYLKDFIRNTMEWNPEPHWRHPGYARWYNRVECLKAWIIGWRPGR